MVASRLLRSRRTRGSWSTLSRTRGRSASLRSTSSSAPTKSRFERLGIHSENGRHLEDRVAVGPPCRRARPQAGRAGPPCRPWRSGAAERARARRRQPIASPEGPHSGLARARMATDDNAYLFGAICPARGVGAALALPYADTEAAPPTNPAPPTNRPPSRPTKSPAPKDRRARGRLARSG